MSDQEKREQEIMSQEMSQDEMDTVAGGDMCNVVTEILTNERRDWLCDFNGAYVACYNGNAKKYGRPLYRPDGYVNCAATVEDGSHCGSNDACYEDEAVYIGMKDCYKAWK